MIKTPSSELLEFRKLCISKGMKNPEDNILKALNSLPPGEVPDFESLNNYLKCYNNSDNKKVIKAFISLVPEIQDSQDPILRKILTKIGFRNPEYYQKLIKKLEKLNFVPSEIHFNDLLNSIKDPPALNDTQQNAFYSFTQFYFDRGFNTKLFTDFLFFNKKIHEKGVCNRTNYYARLKKKILEFLEKFKISFKPTEKEMELACESSLNVTVDIFQDKFGAKFTENCLTKCLEGIGNNMGYCPNTQALLKNMLKDRIKPSGPDLDKLLRLSGRDEYIKILTDNNLLDINIHGPAISSNFNKIFRIDTIKKLIKIGFIPDQKCLENTCLESGNLPILRILIDECGLRPNQVCLENACKHRTNTHAINFLLEKGCEPNIQCMINLSRAMRNPTFTLILEKFIKICGSDHEPLKPIYESDSDNEEIIS